MYECINLSCVYNELQYLSPAIQYNNKKLNSRGPPPGGSTLTCRMCVRAMMHVSEFVMM